MSKYALAESMIKAIIMEHGAQGLAVALNNACVHGEVFLEADLSLGEDDSILQDWYKGIDKLCEVAKKIK